MFEYLRIFVSPEMFFNSSLQVALGFANATSIAACTSKLVDNIGLKKFGDRVFTTEKASNFLTVKMLLQC